MGIPDLNKYRRAIRLVKDLTEAHRRINKAIESLEYYKMYNPVLQSLVSLKDSKLIVEIHLKEQNRIVDNRGEDSQ